ncbi:MAG: hypothetical protein K2P68_06875 [Sphingomonas sp.]|nr:hypothetical protein [Sphingomonas sp.]
MNALMKKVGLAVALGATSLTAAAPAEAQHYRGGYGGHYRHGGDAGVAVAAGIVGLAIGAAIASDNDRYRDRYYYNRGYPRDYDVRYYHDHGYYPDNGYYAYRYREAYPRCYVERRWDPYYGAPVRVRVCR